jgi:tripartite-type tricarboxylate transporter receptor subunit TctC
MHRLTRMTALAVGAVLLSSCSSLSAESEPGETSAVGGAASDFPGSEPVTILMPYTAGGSSDLLVRALQPFLAEELGTDVIVENRVGAGGQIALTELAGAEPDGHTIGLTNLPSSLAYINPDKQATYDGDSFTPLAGINRFRGIVAVSARSEWKNLEDFVDDAKAAPGSLTVGVDGLTGDDHIAALGFEEETGIDLKVVPFDSGSEKLTALIGGQIDVSLGTVPTFKAQLDSGEVRALAALDEERIPDLDDVPTAKEEGYDLLWTSYNVLSAPAGVPDDVVAALEDAISNASEAAMKDDAFTAQMKAGGYVFGFQDSEWATETWSDLEAKWEEFVPKARAEQG